MMMHQQYWIDENRKAAAPLGYTSKEWKDFMYGPNPAYIKPKFLPWDQFPEAWKDGITRVVLIKYRHSKPDIAHVRCYEYDGKRRYSVRINGIDCRIPQFFAMLDLE